jgi:hypothetical protein
MILPEGAGRIFIKLVQYDAEHGKDKTEVWKRLQEHGVTDEDI